MGDGGRIFFRIEDSLTAWDYAGRWVDIATYQAMIYGAVGTEELEPNQGASNPNSNPSSSQLDQQQRTEPPSSPQNVRDLAAPLKLSVEYRGLYRNEMRFVFQIIGSPADLERIKAVTYDVHPTWGG